MRAGTNKSTPGVAAPGRTSRSGRCAAGGGGRSPPKPDEGHPQHTDSYNTLSCVLCEGIGFATGTR